VLVDRGPPRAFRTFGGAPARPAAGAAARLPLDGASRRLYGARTRRPAGRPGRRPTVQDIGNIITSSSLAAVVA